MFLAPTFSVASKQLGKDDERDIFPGAIRLIGEIKPRAVMLENVRGSLDTKFDDYSFIFHVLWLLCYKRLWLVAYWQAFSVPVCKRLR